MVKDGEDFTNNEVEKFRLKFSNRSTVTHRRTLR